MSKGRTSKALNLSLKSPMEQWEKKKKKKDLKIKFKKECKEVLQALMARQRWEKINRLIISESCVSETQKSP